MPKSLLFLRRKKKLFSEGFIAPISIISLAFLFISLIVGIYAISKSNLKFDIRNRAQVPEYPENIPSAITSTPTVTVKTPTPTETVYSDPVSLGCGSCNCSGVASCPYGSQIKCTPPASCPTSTGATSKTPTSTLKPAGASCSSQNCMAGYECKNNVCTKKETVTIGSLFALPSSKPSSVPVSTPVKTPVPTSIVYSSPESLGCGPCNCSGTASCPYGVQVKCTPPESCKKTATPVPAKSPKASPLIASPNVGAEVDLVDPFLKLFGNLFNKDQNQETVQIAQSEDDVKTPTCEISCGLLECVKTTNGGYCKSPSWIDFKKLDQVKDIDIPTSLTTVESGKTPLPTVVKSDEKPFDLATLKDGNKWCSGNYKPGDVVIWGGYVQGCKGGSGSKGGEWVNLSAEGYGPEVLTVKPTWLTSDSKTFKNLTSLAKEAPKYVDSNGVFKEPEKKPWCNTDSGGVPSGSVSMGGVGTRSKCVYDPEHPDTGKWVACSDKPEDVNSYCALTIIPSFKSEEDLKKEQEIYNENVKKYVEIYQQNYTSCASSGRKDCLNEAAKILTANGLNSDVADTIKEQFTTNLALYYATPDALKLYQDCIAKKSEALCVNERANLNKTVATAGIDDIKLAEVKIDYISKEYESVVNQYVALRIESDKCNSDTPPANCKDILNKLNLLKNNPIYKYVEAKNRLNDCHSYAECVYWGTQVETLEKDPVFGDIKYIKYIADGVLSPTEVYEQNKTFQEAAYAIYTHNDADIKKSCLKENGNDQNKCTGKALDEYKNSIIAKIPEDQRNIYANSYKEIENAINSQTSVTPYKTCSRSYTDSTSGVNMGGSCSNGYSCFSGFCVPKEGTKETAAVLTEAQKQEILADITSKQTYCSSQLSGSTYDRATNLCILKTTEIPKVLVIGREVKSSYFCSSSETYSNGKCFLKTNDAYDLAMGVEGYGSFVERYSKQLESCRDQAINNVSVGCDNKTTSFVGTTVSGGFYRTSLNLEFDGADKNNWYGENTAVLYELAQIEAIKQIKGSAALDKYYVSGQGVVDDNALKKDGLFDQVDEKAWALLRANVRNTSPTFLGIQLNNDYSIASKIAVNPSYLEVYSKNNHLNFADIISLNFNPSYKVDENNNLVSYKKEITVTSPVQIGGTTWGGNNLNNYNPSCGYGTGTGGLYGESCNNQSSYTTKITINTNGHNAWDAEINPDNPEYIYNQIYGNGPNSISSTLSLVGVKVDYTVPYSEWIKNDSSKDTLFKYASESSFDYGVSLKNNPSQRYVAVGETVASIGIGMISSVLKPATPAGFAIGSAIEVGGDLVVHAIADALSTSSKEIFMQKLANAKDVDQKIVADTQTSYTWSKIGEYGQIILFDIGGNIVGEGIGKSLAGKNIASNFDDSVVFSLGQKVDPESIARNIADIDWDASRILVQDEAGDLIRVSSKDEALELINKGTVKNWTIAGESELTQAAKILEDAKNKGMGNIFQSYSEKKIVANISEGIGDVSKREIFENLNNVNNVLSESEKSIFRTWVDNRNALKAPLEESVNVGENIKLKADSFNLNLENGLSLGAQTTGQNIAVSRAKSIIFSGSTEEYLEAFKKGIFQADDLIETSSDTISRRIVGETIDDTVLKESFSQVKGVSYPNYVRFSNGEKVVIGGGTDPFMLTDREAGQLVDVVRDGKLTKGVIGSNGLVSDIKGLSSLAVNSKNGLRLAYGIDIDTGKFNFGNWVKSGVFGDDVPLGRLANGINDWRLPAKVVGESENIVLSTTKKIQLTIGEDVIELPNSGYVRIFDADGKVVDLVEIKDGAVISGRYLKEGNYIQISGNSFTRKLTGVDGYVSSFKDISSQIGSSGVGAKRAVSFGEFVNEVFEGGQKKTVTTNVDLVKESRANNQISYKYNVIDIKDPKDPTKVTGVGGVKLVISDDVDPSVRKIIEERALVVEGKVDEGIIKYDAVMRGSGKSKPITRVELNIDNKIVTLEPSAGESPFEFAKKIADRRLSNPQDFINSKVFTEDGESSFFAWNIGKGGDMVQPDVILDSVLVPGAKVVGAPTGLGKSVVAIENIAFLKKELLGPDAKFTIILKNEGDLKEFRSVFSDEAARYLGFGKPYVMKNIPPLDSELEAISQAKVFVGTSDTIFNSLDDSKMGKKITEAMRGSVLIGDEAHISLRTDVDYIKSVGGSQAIGLSRAERFQELFKEDGLLGDLTAKHIEDLKLNRESQLLVDGVGGGKVFSKEVRDDAYARIINQRIKEYPDVIELENVLKSSDLQGSLDALIHNPNINQDLVKALDFDISAFNSAERVFADIPSNNYGLATKIFVDDAGDSFEVPAIVPKENNVFTGRQYSAIDDELAYQYLGRKFLGEPVDDISTLKLFVTPDSVGTNYGRFLKDTFNLDESLVLSATPGKIQGQWMNRFGISTTLYGSKPEEVISGIADRLKNSFFSVKSLDDIEVSDAIKTESGVSNVYVIGANRTNNQELVFRLGKSSAENGRDMAVIKGSGEVVLYKPDGVEIKLDGNYKFLTSGGQEITVREGLGGIEDLQKLYNASGNDPLDIIYELGKNYGTDLNTLPLNSKFITIFDSSTDATDFIQTVGRDRCKDGGCRALSAIFLGQDSMDLDSFTNLINTNEAKNLARIGVSDIDGEIRNAGYRFIQELEDRNKKGLLGGIFGGQSDFDKVYKDWRATSDLDLSLGSKALTPEEYIAEQTNRLQRFINELSDDASFRRGLSSNAQEFLQGSKRNLFTVADIHLKTGEVSEDLISPLSNALNAEQLVSNINSTFSKESLPEFISGKNLSSGQIKAFVDVQKQLAKESGQKVAQGSVGDIAMESLGKLVKGAGNIGGNVITALKPKNIISGVSKIAGRITNILSNINQTTVTPEAQKIDTNEEKRIVENIKNIDSYQEINNVLDTTNNTERIVFDVINKLKENNAEEFKNALDSLSKLPEVQKQLARAYLKENAAEIKQRLENQDNIKTGDKVLVGDQEENILVAHFADTKDVKSIEENGLWGVTGRDTLLIYESEDFKEAYERNKNNKNKTLLVFSVPKKMIGYADLRVGGKSQDGKGLAIYNAANDTLNPEIYQKILNTPVLVNGVLGTTVFKANDLGYLPSYIPKEMLSIKEDFNLAKSGTKDQKVDSSQKSTKPIISINIDFSKFPTLKIAGEKIKVFVQNGNKYVSQFFENVKKANLETKLSNNKSRIVELNNNVKSLEADLNKLNLQKTNLTEQINSANQKLRDNRVKENSENQRNRKILSDLNAAQLEEQKLKDAILKTENDLKNDTSGYQEKIRSEIENLEKALKLDSLERPEAYKTSLNSAINKLNDGGIVILPKNVPTIAVSDLHARREFLLELLRKIVNTPEGNMTVYQALDRGLYNIVLLGDGMHSEDSYNWKPGGDILMNYVGDQDNAEFRAKFFEEKERLLDREMVRTLGLMKMVMDLKAKFPNNFHYVRGNHDDINGSFYKYDNESEDVRDWMLKKQGFGQDFINRWNQFESSLPLVAIGNGFVASHSIPERELTAREIKNYNSYGEDIRRAVNWTDNRNMSEGALDLSVRGTLRNLNLSTSTLWIIGHRPTAGEDYRSQLNGQIIQINHKARNIIANIPLNTKFNPKTDVENISGKLPDIVVTQGGQNQAQIAAININLNRQKESLIKAQNLIQNIQRELNNSNNIIRSLSEDSQKIQNEISNLENIDQVIIDTKGKIDSFVKEVMGLETENGELDKQIKEIEVKKNNKPAIVKTIQKERKINISLAPVHKILQRFNEFQNRDTGFYAILNAKLFPFKWWKIIRFWPNPLTTYDILRVSANIAIKVLKVDVTKSVETEFTTRALSESEKKLFDDLDKDNNQFQLTKDLLKVNDFYPQEVLEIGKEKYFFFSKIVRTNGGKGREQALMFVQKEDGRIYPRILYKSNSDGGWRSTEGFIYNTNGKIRYLKGRDVRTENGHYTQETKPHQGIIKYLESAEERNLFVNYNGDLIGDYFNVVDLYENIDTFKNETSIYDDGGTLSQFKKYQPGLYGDINYEAPTAEIFANFNYPKDFLPDFSKGPTKVETTIHTLLEKVTLETFEAKLNGRDIEWVFAYDKDGRIWIERINFKNGEISSYGTYKEVINSGALTNKPLEYGGQVANLIKGKDYKPYNTSYADITPLIKNLKPIKLFEEYKNKQQNSGDVTDSKKVDQVQDQTKVQQPQTSFFSKIRKFLITGSVLGVMLLSLLGNNVFGTSAQTLLNYSQIQRPAIVQEINQNLIQPLEVAQIEPVQQNIETSVELNTASQIKPPEVFGVNKIKAFSFPASGKLHFSFQQVSNPYSLVPDWVYDKVIPKVVSSEYFCKSAESCKYEAEHLPIVNHLVNEYRVKIDENFGLDEETSLLDYDYRYNPMTGKYWTVEVRADIKNQVQYMMDEVRKAYPGGYIIAVEGRRGSYQQGQANLNSPSDSAAAGFSQHISNLAIDFQIGGIPNKNEVLEKYGWVHPFSIETVGWDDGPHWFYLDGVYPGLTKMIRDAGYNPHDINVIQQVLLGLHRTYSAREIDLGKAGNAINVSTQSSSVGTNKINTSSQVIYSQLDSRWANTYVGEGITIKDVGCGVVSVANITQKDPSEVLKLYKIGKDISEGGTSVKANANTLIKLGYKVNTGTNNDGVLVTQIRRANQTNNYSEVLKSLEIYLKEGWQIMLNGNFSNLGGGGHWVVVTGVDVNSKEITVIDPNGGITKKYSFDGAASSGEGTNKIAPKKVLLAKETGTSSTLVNASVIPFLNAQMFENLSEKYIYSEWPETREEGILPVLFKKIKNVINERLNKNKVIPITGSNDQDNAEIIVNGTRIQYLLLGETDPLFIDINNPKENEMILYHGSSKVLHVREDYNPSIDENSDGSETLGTGLYTTDNKEQAEKYAELRGGSNGGYLSVVIPKNAIMLDLRENTPIPEDIFQKWVDYWLESVPSLKKRLIEDNGQAIAEILFETVNKYTEFLLKIKDIKDDPNKRNIRYVLATMNIPEYGIRFYPGQSQNSIFREFMLSLGFDGIIAPEGGDTKDFGYADSYVFFNYSKVGTLDDWKEREPIDNNLDFSETNDINASTTLKSFVSKVTDQFNLGYFKLTGITFFEEKDVFDASEEIKKLWLTKPNSEERKLAKDAFMQKYAYQQMGLSEMKIEIENAIKVQPSLEYSELIKIYDKYRSQYKFPEKFRLTIFEFYKDYRKVRKNLISLRKKFKDKKELFKQFFGRYPKGEITVVYQPLNVLFIVPNEDDYVNIHSRNTTDTPVSKEIREYSVATGGFQGTRFVDWEHYFFTVVRDINDNISISHEERHVISEFLEIYTDIVPTVMISKNVTITPELLSGYLDQVEEYVLEHAKNEIISYFSTDGTSMEAIIDEINIPFNKGGHYDYYNWFSSTGWAYQRMFRNLTNKQKDDANKYWSSLISDPKLQQRKQDAFNEAKDAVNYLIENGLDKKQIISLLENEPLYKWPTIAKRIKPLFDLKFEEKKTKVIDIIGNIDWKDVDTYRLLSGEVLDYFQINGSDADVDTLYDIFSSIEKNKPYLTKKQALNYLKLKQINDYYGNLDTLWNNNDITEFVNRTTFIKSMIDQINEDNINWDNVISILFNGPVGKRYTTPFAWVSSGFNSQQVHTLFKSLSIVL